MAHADQNARWIRLTELLAPFHAQALATARRLSRSVDDGDDLYQESLQRAFEKLPALRDPDRFRSWFFAVLLSVHRSRARRRAWKRFFSWEEAHAQGLDPAGLDGRRHEEARQGSTRAAMALSSLKPAEREAVVLFDLEGLSLEEVAGLQQASLSAIKSRLARGRKHLRAYYRKRGWISTENQPAALLRAVPLLAKRESGHD
jgi:RNA polymerase sigma-70 factor (ECF subfamily)